MPLALPAIVVVTALGALVMCLLVIRYGFTADIETDDDRPDDDDTGPPGPESYVRLVRRRQAARRLLVTRVGHTVAAVCFAVAAILAVVALTERPTARPAPSAVSAAASSEAEVDRLREQLRELQSQLEERIRSVEARLGLAASRPGDGGPPGPETSAEKTPGAPPEPATPSTGSRGSAAGRPSEPRRGTSTESRAAVLPPRTPPTSPPSPPPQVGRRSADADRAASAAADREPTSAFPRRGNRAVSTTVGNVGVEITSDSDRPTPGRETSYTVRLSDAAGRPLLGADVTMRGRMADGTTVQAPLDPAAAGIYRGGVVFTPSGPLDLRLRVAHRGQAFELPVPGQAAR
jgi:hypothetical protein